MKRTKLLSGIGLILLFIVGCRSTDYAEQLEKEQIQKYIGSLGDTVYLVKSSGLYYIELQGGTGVSPVATDTIALRHKGWFLDGRMFDSNLSDTVPFRCIVGTNAIIMGLDEGVKYMKAGGKAKFLTPSNLAYGKVGYPGTIPGFTPLIWEITLVRVQPGPGHKK